MSGFEREYPYHEWHGWNIPIECGACYAIYQRHNKEGPCLCRVCQTTALTPIHEGQWDKVSTLNICDRCETPATSNAMGSFTKRLTVNDRVESLELCPGCVAEFVAFMLGTTQDRPKAYKEPYEEKTVEPESTLKQALLELLAGKDEGTATFVEDEVQTYFDTRD